MSINLSTLVVDKFETEVRHDFQQNISKLRDSVLVKDASGASTVKFNRMNKGTTYKRGAIHTPIPLANIGTSRPTVTVEDYTISEMTDIFLNNKVNFDERQELVKLIRSSLNRRMDQLIIDALNNATITNVVANNISGSVEDLTVAALREAALLLDKNNVPMEDRVAAIHASGMHNLTGDTSVTSSDFVVNQPLMSGGVGAYYGFNFRTFGDLDEGGLPIDGSLDRTNFIWQKGAVGLAVNMEPRVEVNYDPAYGAHRVTGFLSANALVIDQEGIVEVTTRETA